MREEMLFNTRTGRWEKYRIITKRLKTPWLCLWIWLKATARLAHRNSILFPKYETVYVYNPDRMNFSDPKRERRMRRMDRHDRLVASIANALNSMIEMQKHLN